MREAVGGKPASSSGIVGGLPGAQIDPATLRCRGRRQPGISTEQRGPSTTGKAAQEPILR